MSENKTASPIKLCICVCACACLHVSMWFVGMWFHAVDFFKSGEWERER